MKHHLASSLLALALAGSAAAAPIAFDFKDPKGVNAIAFHLDSLLEPIAGTANDITGTVTFDPAAPGSLSGTIVVATSSLMVTNSTMRDHLLSEGWVDAAGHPEITIQMDELEDLGQEFFRWEMATAAASAVLRPSRPDAIGRVRFFGWARSASASRTSLPR